MPLGNDTDLNALLRKAGIAAGTADAVMQIDGMLQQWRRRAMKRELGQRALVDLRIGIDLPQLDVLTAIEGPAPEFCGAGEETMVATVAERLNIDPSRASRLVSEMVERGFARRAVSQADARRTIIELTAQGATAVAAVRAYKYLLLGDFLSGWTPEELVSFVPLLKRFSSWADGADAAAEKYAADIDELARSLGPAAPVPEKMDL